MFRLNFKPSKEHSNMKKRNIIFLLIPIITACGVNSFQHQTVTILKHFLHPKHLIRNAQNTPVPHGHRRLLPMPNPISGIVPPL